MVDCLAYRKMVPNAQQEIHTMPFRSSILTSVPPEEVHICVATVFGYSFACKKWGRLIADQFIEIEWNTDTFEALVLDQEKKTLVESLVFADHNKLIRDVVPTKAGGSIVILHGKPGTGKTLTAEAAAEKGKKPLMVVSSAEFTSYGTSLETSLKNILQVCKEWEAVLLIDEADVYLEARSMGDVGRNAMVSVFLRLLEYHQQVIFLTTNHITRLDAAFKSRISVAINYPDLDETARRRIWTRFLVMAEVKLVETRRMEGENEITKPELSRLIERDLNGRYAPFILDSRFCTDK